MFHFQVLVNVERLRDTYPKEFCRIIGVPDTYATEFCKMLALDRLMREQGAKMVQGA